MADYELVTQSLLVANQLVTDALTAYDELPREVYEGATAARKREAVIAARTAKKVQS